ncbi:MULTISPECIES: MOSC domain-containing protein [Lysinibacillus]|uniref:MOSC domain-containing protein n=1 Tax=Lysinibacillus TaxID=400634 RepID=UPI0021A59DB9|nr:MOSC domain-containing protein [Lysinibacillus capsici]MCT1541469.1 MOSC domain-containing protein [Lysinibacillus capsici]MCT1572631.1 MOSC domain-containing protein [Lysinibacillus capsici]MCT1649871.1 MOSC domain-containing protein [Lysinibacillus capsici]MCT1728275.1 MOSC domain-containing protein [Lysinibacillus capsici]MCT1786032.1 MOSC domain-containing protein [Lysinibacillus capsici]
MEKNKPMIYTLTVGMPKELVDSKGRSMITGIEKQRVQEVYLSSQGFEGDEVADKKHHGGPDRAVCLYPAEHYIQWEQELGKTLPVAAFGENLTVTNMLESDVCIGDIYKIGDAVIQITQGRIPCSTIDRYTEANTLLKRLIETGYTGFLARVLEEGTICADSTIELVEKHPARISVLYCNEVYFKNNDAIAMKQIQAVDALAEDWKEKLEKRIQVLQRKVMS